MSSIMFYLGWIILPLLVEFIPSIGNFLILIKKKIRLNRKSKEYDRSYYPPISIIVPVYNSAATLHGCIRSIAESDYDISAIDVFCIDNGSKDDSFDVFQKCQIEFSDLAMNWMQSAQGKSNALNKALFNCEGKYIINIDSDGKLEKNALLNMAVKFEQDEEVAMMTGAVLTDPELIGQNQRKFLTFFQNIEFMEYCQAFLAGRNYQSETNSIFTVSGAFSAFRKSTLFKTHLYNTETICEDAHLTFQVKENLKQKVVLCEDAVFMVDPIEGFNKYYTQRQRWQIGELEVMHMFLLEKMKHPINMLLDSSTRLILIDHTAEFPKFIWFFVMFILCFTNDMLGIVGIAFALIYCLSLTTAILYFINVILYLDKFEEIRSEYRKRWYYLLFMPLYTLFSGVVRFCGILNSIGRPSAWKTKTFAEEKKEIQEQVKEDFHIISSVSALVREIVER